MNVQRPALEVVEMLKRNDVLVAEPFPLYDTSIRVSLGTPPEMREFWRAWDSMPGHKMSM